VTSTTKREDPRAYYRLCKEAEALGIPTSLDDPDSPRTVEGLKETVAAKRERAEEGDDA
jgi:hypothetical protein